MTNNAKRSILFLVGAFSFFYAISSYLSFESNITRYNLAYRGFEYLQPNTPDEVSKQANSFIKQGDIKEKYEKKYPSLFKMLDKHDFTLKQNIANNVEQYFYNKYEPYMFPFISADDWADFRHKNPYNANIFAAYVQEMKAAEVNIPGGHNPPKRVILQKIKDERLTQKIWVGGLAGLGILCFALRRGISKDET